jgi:hypothetical protein
MLDATDDEVIVLGHVEQGDGDVPVLAVSEAFRGMPGLVSTLEDEFYNVTLGDCTQDDCYPPVARRLNVGSPLSLHDIDVTRVEEPWIDHAWLHDRVLMHGALVAARYEDGSLNATQVFLRLPEQVGPCAEVKGPACGTGEVATFTRDANRCLVPAGCSYPDICPLPLPRCAPGYKLQSWLTGSLACAAFACDPTFTVNPSAE